MTRNRSRGRRGPSRRVRLLATIATGAILVAGVGAWVVYGTAAFAVEKIQVRGATFTDSDRVRDAAAVALGTSIAALDTDAVAARVGEVASVRSVSVERDWPHGVVITITERKARLAVPKGGKFVLVDDTGVAFRTVSKRPAGTVKTEVSDPGRDDPATRAVLEVLPKLTPELEKLLVSVEAPTRSRIELRLEQSRTVFWGDASKSDRKAEVATVLLERPERHLDVSAPDVPTVS